MELGLHRRDFLFRSAGALSGTALAARLADRLRIPARAPVKPGGDDLWDTVRWIIDLPREKALERAASGLLDDRLKPEVLLGATFLAAVEEISPHPVGFKFHAAMVPAPVARIAGRIESEAARLPLLWCLDNVKASQLRDEREGDWKLGPPKADRLPAPDKALERLRAALESWDEEAADAAASACTRGTAANDAFEVFFEYATRCLSNIGHKPIYAVMARRSLTHLGPQHTEPVLRSLVRALLDQTYGTETDSFPRSRELIDQAPVGWDQGKPDPAAARTLLERLRSASQVEGAEAVFGLLKRGIAPASLWDGIIAAASEIVLQGPNIVCLHAMTAAHALHTIGLDARSPRTRLLALLQAGAWIPYYRMRRHGGGALPAEAPRIDRLEAEIDVRSELTHEELVLDRLAGAKRIRAQCTSDPRIHRAVTDLAVTAVRDRGADVHEYKFAYSVLEEAHRASAEFRPWILSTLPFHLPPADGAERESLRRCRALLAHEPSKR